MNTLFSTFAFRSHFDTLLQAVKLHGPQWCG